MLHTHLTLFTLNHETAKVRKRHSVSSYNSVSSLHQRRRQMKLVLFLKSKLYLEAVGVNELPSVFQGGSVR